MSWRFAVTPKWLVRHVLVLGLVGSMIWLGFWQLRRLDEKQTHKALVEARQEQPVADVEEVVPVDADVDDANVTAVLYRSVRAAGTYEAADTVVVENRTHEAVPGAWVLTPLRLDDGRAVVVNRGFIRYDRQGDIVAPAPPAGRVTIEGLVFPSQNKGRFGPTDPKTGRLDVLARADLTRLQAQVASDLLPAYVQLVKSDPSEAAPAPGAPALVGFGPPSLDVGSHLSYAMQWFIFTTIAGGGYALLLRRVARDQGRLVSGDPPLVA